MGEANSKKIVQYSLDGTFIKNWESASEAARVLGIQSSLISKCCNRTTKHCREFIFRFEGDIVTEEEKNPKINKTRSLKVEEYINNKLEKTWKSITSLSKELSIERKKLKSLLEVNPLTINNHTYKLAAG